MRIKMTILFWILRVLAAVIMLQTLYFKFSGAEESIYIFSTLGMEPWGRIGTGVVELIASVLLLIPRTTPIGALLGLAVMSGALFFHLTKLGIEVKGDHGQLFIYALLVFISCLVLAWSFRKKLFNYIG
ncbi:MAG: DoxX family protein [Chitinophagaceae bacterium]|nr:DoxX family protein [Chitinophagaceae bacterium]